jgi:DNA-binding beta-propeller fold protein YncE
MSRTSGRSAAILVLLLAALGGCSGPPAHHPSAPGPPTPLAAGCSARAAPGRPLAAPSLRTMAVPGHPYAAVTLPGGRWAVVSLAMFGDVGTRGELALLATGGGVARLVRTVTLPPPTGGASGMVLTHDGRVLLVAGTADTAVVSVAGLERGDPHPVIGVLSDSGVGQYEVAVSGDDHYVFVTDESSGGLSVFDLALALRRGFSAPGVAAGMIPLANAPVGVAVAPGGAWIYVTTLGGFGPHGRLWVIDARQAEHGAGRTAVAGQVPAGCQPVRVALSPDGGTAWVTALQSNALLGFDTASLRRDPSRALRAVVPVGSEPVGLLLLDNGHVALIGDSSRFLGPGSGADAPQLSLVSTESALAHRPAVIGSLPAGGLFPRDLGYDQRAGQVLVPDFASGDVELVRLPALR